MVSDSPYGANDSGSGNLSGGTQYLITYKGNDPDSLLGINEVKNLIEKQYMLSGDFVTLSQAPNRVGYDFRGWSTSKTGDSQIFPASSSYSGRSNVTMNAIWKITPNWQHWLDRLFAGTVREACFWYTSPQWSNNLDTEWRTALEKRMLKTGMLTDGVGSAWEYIHTTKSNQNCFLYAIREVSNDESEESIYDSRVKYVSDSWNKSIDTFRSSVINYINSWKADWSAREINNQKSLIFKDEYRVAMRVTVDTGDGDGRLWKQHHFIRQSNENGRWVEKPNTGANPTTYNDELVELEKDDYGLRWNPMYDSETRFMAVVRP